MQAIARKLRSGERFLPAIRPFFIWRFDEVLLVYLPDKTVGTAEIAAYKLVDYINEIGTLTCPVCGSAKLFYSRKSESNSRWMELVPRCGECYTRFSIPDNILSSFWRNAKQQEISVCSF